MLFISLFQLDNFINSFWQNHLGIHPKWKKIENNNVNNIINFNHSNSLSSIFNFDNFFGNNITNIFYKLSNFSYIFNFDFNIIQVEYSILFHFQNNSIITPSDLTLYYGIHLVCHIIGIKSNIKLDSVASIKLNKFFHCIEFVNINEKLRFGIKLYKKKNKTSFIDFTHFFFFFFIFNYNKGFSSDNEFFNPKFIEKEYYLTNKNNILNLKKLYSKAPVCSTITDISFKYNKWIFLNIYNHYFCFCRGKSCLYNLLMNYQNEAQICKYKFYLNLIEENKYLYNKTDYLLADFPWDYQSFDDAFPVFLNLIKLKKKAHYMTINKNLLQKIKPDNYLYNYIIKGGFINGDFIEKYFSLFLRLKVVISGAEYLSFDNLFYYIEYITFISLTHGLNYFKTGLFKTYYGRNRYHKLVISNSKKLIYLAVQNGWEEKDLIKICLPKWDKINEFKKRNITTNKSIFFFFTWRVWNKNITDEMKIKSIYFQNIIELINNKILNEFLNKKGITINFCLHHMLEIFVNKLNLRNRKIKYIKQNEIFQNIMKSSLLVTDFSSIIFEFIYQKKPYIMYIPDSEDPNIDIFYDKDYFNLIKRLKDGSVFFMNKYFSINHVVDKIIYYINNDFNLEQNLTDFYDSFNLTCENNTMKFINYLENLENKS